MTIAKPVFVGVDIGASRAKAVVLDGDKNLLGFAVEKSGTDFMAVADRCLTTSLKMAGVSKNNIVKVDFNRIWTKKCFFRPGNQN